MLYSELVQMVTDALDEQAQALMDEGVEELAMLRADDNFVVITGSLESGPPKEAAFIELRYHGASTPDFGGSLPTGVEVRIEAVFKPMERIVGLEELARANERMEILRRWLVGTGLIGTVHTVTRN